MDTYSIMEQSYKAELKCSFQRSHTPWVSQGRFRREVLWTNFFKEESWLAKCTWECRHCYEQQAKGKEVWEMGGILGELTSSCVGSVWVKQY